MLVLFTDSDCDITKKQAKNLGCKLISMPYIIDDKEVKPYEDFEEFDAHPFYERLRNGTLPKTCAINPEKYKEYFEPEFKAGNDILYVHFSTAMSGTFNAMQIAVTELKETYPNVNFYDIDTKGITINAYSIVVEIAKKAKEGMSAPELVKYGNELADHTACYFFADSLKFFRNSGRVTNIQAVMGGLIGIKPILYMDENGMMTSIAKAKGRTKALQQLIQYFDELGDDIHNHPIVIGHSDNLELAQKLGELLVQKYGDSIKDEIEYVMVNPTAGSHCGPDGIGLCFHSLHK